MKTLAEAIKCYRKQRKKMARAQRRMDQLDAQIQALQKIQAEDRNENLKLKELIDYCIVTGESPAEASLKNTRAQMRAMLMPYSDSITMASGSTLTGNVTIIPGAGGGSGYPGHTVIVQGINSISGGYSNVTK